MSFLLFFMSFFLLFCAIFHVILYYFPFVLFPHHFPVSQVVLIVHGLLNTSLTFPCLFAKLMHGVVALVFGIALSSLPSVS